MPGIHARALLVIILATFQLLTPCFAQVDTVGVFNEVHYHPLDDVEENGPVEFVELFNQNSVDVDLSGWTLEGVGDFVFPIGTVIAGRGFLVVAKDPAALEGATGFADALGPFTARLDNDGERLILRNHNGRSMDILDYADSHPWASGPDGWGATLAKRKPLEASGPAADWAASRALHGDSFA